MILASKHFNRTYTFGRLLGIKFDRDFTSFNLTGENAINQLHSNLKDQWTSFKESDRERIQEIFFLEKEKFHLRDSINNVDEILRLELSYNIEREKLLKSKFNALLQEVFVKNKMVHLYVSNWKWFVRDPFQNPYDLKQILNAKKTENFFLLERSGTFDVKSDSNIFEFPLSEYQYFLIQQFEKPRNLKEVHQQFINLFEISNKEEEKELQNITESLIEDLIFRRFIVSTPGNQPEP